VEKDIIVEWKKENAQRSVGKELLSTDRTRWENKKHE